MLSTHPILEDSFFTSTQSPIWPGIYRFKRETLTGILQFFQNLNSPVSGVTCFVWPLLLVLLFPNYSGRWGKADFTDPIFCLHRSTYAFLPKRKSIRSVAGPGKGHPWNISVHPAGVMSSMSRQFFPGCPQWWGTAGHSAGSSLRQ